MTQTERHSFEAEVSRLLHLMVHSVYSNKDIFLRELISNAADACEKLRYLSIAEPQLAGEGGFAITLSADKDKKTLTVADNGIGMSHDELKDNLGTIARSGTRASSWPAAKSSQPSYHREPDALAARANASVCQQLHSEKSPASE